MTVPKGKRKESQFEVIKHFYRLRKDITDLLNNLKEECYV